MRASTDLQFGAVPVTVRGTLAWRHAFGDIAPKSILAFADSDTFAVRGAPIVKDAALIEAGLDINFTPNASIGVAYQGQIASNARGHGFNAKLRIRF
ncbi:autotransporter domain-containing protein [Pusillimonas sp. CC-YST705]|uniref:Autotransporter domain-containing protein n=1 Tax=Mesopusillimonas faecipullorum TaxID=2755040 RepID=A0ABS8C8P6_9BURK|nr:autotransporter domain-containing protein [Mesopusillimonas faecipullorum]MCB5362388.1 autotransporter domain-containing protein [Mesopusillimonas faecipullorum]